MLAVFENLLAIYENVLHADSVLTRIGEGGTIADPCWIKDDDIGKHPFLDEAAMIETEVCRRERAQSAHGFTQREQFFLARIFPEHTREGSVGTRMRSRFQKNAFRCLRSFIGAE